MATMNPTKTRNYKPKKYNLYITCSDTSINPSQNQLIISKAMDLMTVQHLKNLIDKYWKISPACQRLFYKQQELQHNNDYLYTYEIKSNSTIHLFPVIGMAMKNIGQIKEYELFEQTPRDLEKLLQSVKESLKYQRKPKATSQEQGTSGSYFLENDQKQSLAIFKPLDEEPYAPNNPKNYKGELGSMGLREGVLSGECASREVFAYLLDYYSRFWHGVPPTTFVEFYHPSFEESSEENVKQDLIPVLNNLEGTQNSQKIKYGSLQAFVKHNDFIGNYGESVLDVSQIHKIAILDIRILNCDRNEENVLVKKLKDKTYKLIPIDHGFSLPDPIIIYDYEIVWYEWKAAKTPFSQEELVFIQNIDPVADCQRLSKSLKIRPVCLRNFRIANTVLKKCALKGLNLYEIGSLIYRNDEEERSTLEKLISLAEEKMLIKKQITKKNKTISKEVKDQPLKKFILEDENLLQKSDKICSQNSDDSFNENYEMSDNYNQNDNQLKPSKYGNQITQKDKEYLLPNGLNSGKNILFRLEKQDSFDNWQNDQLYRSRPPTILENIEEKKEEEDLINDLFQLNQKLKSSKKYQQFDLRLNSIMLHNNLKNSILETPPQLKERCFSSPDLRIYQNIFDLDQKKQSDKSKNQKKLKNGKNPITSNKEEESQKSWENQDFFDCFEFLLDFTIENMVKEKQGSNKQNGHPRNRFYSTEID